MINLDERYHSYLNSNKRFNIDGVNERVVVYGYSDDGKSLTGYYVTTENYQMHYDMKGNFKRKELRNLNN